MARYHGDDHSSLLPELYSIFRGEVASLQPYGVFVKIPGTRKNGLVHKTQISKMKIDNPAEVLEVGDRVYCKVISLGESGEEKISLSMKVVNQDSGKDLDENLIITKQEEQRRKKGLPPVQNKIELGAILNTVCRKCGMKGHLTQDCFKLPGAKTYELIPELDSVNKPSVEEIQIKKSKKVKKEKKRRKKKCSSSANESSSDEERKHSRSKKKRKKRKTRESSSDDGGSTQRSHQGDRDSKFVRRKSEQSGGNQDCHKDMARINHSEINKGSPGTRESSFDSRSSLSDDEPYRNEIERSNAERKSVQSDRRDGGRRNHCKSTKGALRTRKSSRDSERSSNEGESYQNKRERTGRETGSCSSDEEPYQNERESAKRKKRQPHKRNEEKKYHLKKGLSRTVESSGDSKGDHERRTKGSSHSERDQSYNEDREEKHRSNRRDSSPSDLEEDEVQHRSRNKRDGLEGRTADSREGQRKHFSERHHHHHHAR